MQLQDFGAIIQNLNKQLEQDPENIELLLKLAEVHLKVEGDDYYNSVIVLDKILELDPVNFPANRIRGLIYKEQDNTEKARECFKTILDTYSQIRHTPEYLETCFDYAETLEMEDSDEEALNIYEDLLKQNPDNIAVLFKLAHIYSAEARTKEAIDMYKQILEIDPENDAALNSLSELYEKTDKGLYHLTRAEMAFNEGNINKAIAEYKKVIPHLQEAQAECEIYKKMAMAYSLLEDYNQALDQYNLAIDLNEEDYEIYKGLGKLYIDLEEIDTAIECFMKAVELQSQDYSLFVDLAECYMDLEKYPEAVRELEIVKKHKPDDLEIRCAIAEAYIHIRDLYHAGEELDYVLAREPENTIAIGLMVDLNAEKENYEKAKEWAEKLGKLLPTSAYSARKLAECYEPLGEKYLAAYNYGLAFELQKEYGLAIDQYEQAVALKPDNAELIMKIGDLYSSLDEKYVGIEYYERAAEAEPNNPLPLEKLGKFYMGNNDYDRAMDVYSRLVEIDTRNSEACYNLAKLYERSNYNEDALQAYEKLLQIAPNSTKSDEVKKKVLKLRKKLGLEIEEEGEEFYDADMTLFEKIVNYFKR
jgi:superkiller protein 3